MCSTVIWYGLPHWDTTRHAVGDLTRILPSISTLLQLDQLVRHSTGCKGSTRSSAQHPHLSKIAFVQGMLGIQT